MHRLDLGQHAPVVLFLREPREKMWGVLLSIEAAGITVRGLDLNAFEDWLRQETRGGEPMIGPATVFYPMHRIERLERDETVGPIPSYADRYAAEAGRSLLEALGLLDAD